MELVVVEDFNGTEMGIFSTFPKGTELEFVGKDDESLYWCPCITQEGQGFWTPDVYLDGKTLNRDYNPTSLTASAGERLTLQRVVYEWFYVKNEQGNEGWIAANVVRSIEEE